MATRAQLNELIRLILAQGDLLLGLDELVNGTAEEIAAALTMLPRPEAVRVARDRAETLRGTLRNAEAERIANIVADTLEKGGSPADAMRRIRDHVGLTARDERALEALREELIEDGVSLSDIAEELAEAYTDKLNDRAANIAQYEIGNALEEGNQQAAREGGATHKACVDTGDSRVCEEICQPNVERGVIPIDEPYPSGEMHPPFHVMCRCSEAYFTDPSPSRIERINEQQMARLERAAQADDAGDTGEERR